jgi:serine/threonine-protein kinase RsbT
MTSDETCIAIPLNDLEGIVRARQAGRDAGRALGFGIADQTRLATAISEISRNAVRYGGGGHCDIISTRLEQVREITITICDQGPGIPDIEKALTSGFSTGNSLGMGLPGAKRLMDSLQLESEPGRTRVVMVMRRRGLK